MHIKSEEQPVLVGPPQKNITIVTVKLLIYSLLVSNILPKNSNYGERFSGMLAECKVSPLVWPHRGHIITCSPLKWLYSPWKGTLEAPSLHFSPLEGSTVS